MDDAIGRVLDTLDEKNLRDNTLVMCISDMGAVMRPTHGFNAASNFSFRDGSPSMYEVILVYLTSVVPLDLSSTSFVEVRPNHLEGFDCDNGSLCL
jgi:arylsulfatase A-like enzyme